MRARAARPGEEPRAPFEQPVDLRFKSLSDFVGALAANISSGGMFVRTDRPHPVGSIFEFEFSVGDDGPLIAGKAQVCWVRRARRAGAHPAGMGVRFVELDEPSRRIIRGLVEEIRSGGGEPFDLARAGVAADPDADAADEPPSPALPDAPASQAPPGAESGGEPTETPAVAPPAKASRVPPWALLAAPAEPVPPLQAETAPPVPAPAAPPPSATPPASVPPPEPAAVSVATPAPASKGSARRRLSAGLGGLLFLLALAALAALTLLLTREQYAAPGADLPDAAAPASSVGSVEPEAADPAPPAARGTDPGSGPAAADPAREVAATVEAWARAWSEQRVDDYLAHYSAGFVPPNGLGRAAWEAQRRLRIPAPAWIAVRIALVETELEATDRARVDFVQAYESESYRDVVRKRLEMRREDAGWRITREEVVE